MQVSFAPSLLCSSSLGADLIPFSLFRRAQDASRWHPLFSFSVPTALLPSLAARPARDPPGEIQTVEEEIRELVRQRVKNIQVGAAKGKLQQKWSKSVKVEIEVKSGARLDRVAL